MAAKTTTASTKKASPKKTAPAKEDSGKKVTTRTSAAKNQPAATKDKKISALDAAAKVLAEAGEPMRAKEMIDAMAAKGYWTSPGGATPHATLYSALMREINTKGTDSRFQKTDRGLFATNG